MPSSSDEEFERERPARRPLQDLGVHNVVEVSSDTDNVIGSTQSAAVTRQIFYFSKKLFDFMCAGATEERIEQAALRNAADRKGALIRRGEAEIRTDKLRDFVVERGAGKPCGSKYAAVKRKRAAQKKNTDIQIF